MSDDLNLRTQLGALLKPFMDDHREAEDHRAEMEARLETVFVVIARIEERLDRIEAHIAVQTGTVFGAQGDSDPMTLTDETNKEQRP